MNDPVDVGDLVKAVIGLDFQLNGSENREKTALKACVYGSESNRLHSALSVLSPHKIQQEGSPLSETKCRILCVDDHDDTSEMLSILLSQQDYSVLCAPNASEALTLAMSEEFDLYVLDKRLPDGDGLALCQRLTEITPNVPCLFYSGDAYSIHRLQAIEAGAAAYVAKPDIEGLIENVRKLLSERECSAKV